uniref:Candidate secreted effector n=1 Tax=Meloidogyne incognita TaxID=6306 RepID=A0A914L5H4_MELIC
MGIGHGFNTRWIFLTCSTSDEHTHWLGVLGGDSQTLAAYGWECLERKEGVIETMDASIYFRLEQFPATISTGKATTRWT